MNNQKNLSRIFSLKTAIALLLFFSTFSCNTPEQPTPGLPRLDITAISPGNGYPGDIITIMGEGFSTVAEENRVFFNEAPAEVIQTGEVSLEVRVPDGGKSGPVSVTRGESTVQGPVFQYE